MNETTFTLWGALICLTLLDFYLRWRFNIPYLGYSLPVRTRQLNKRVNLLSLTPGKIIETESTKYLFDVESSGIWLQCRFKNRQSTLGLLKSYKVGPDRQTIVTEQVRISLGVVLNAIAFIPFLYIVNQSHPLLSNSPEILIVIPVVMLINFAIAYRRLERESMETIRKFFQ